MINFWQAFHHDGLDVNFYVYGSDKSTFYITQPDLADLLEYFETDRVRVIAKSLGCNHRIEYITRESVYRRIFSYDEALSICRAAKDMHLKPNRCKWRVSNSEGVIEFLNRVNDEFHGQNKIPEPESRSCASFGEEEAANLVEEHELNYNLGNVVRLILAFKNSDGKLSAGDRACFILRAMSYLLREAKSLDEE